MTWTFFASAAALVTAATATDIQPPKAFVPDLTDVAHEVIDLEQERHRRLTVPVTVMGQGPYKFLIDTGSQATVLSTDLADALELHERETATLIAMNSSRVVETTFVPELTVGSRTTFIRTAPLLEGANIGGADGILGLDSLQDQRVVLDFANKQILVAHADELGGQNGYEIVVRARRELGQLIITQAKLDGVRTAVIIDTGAQGSIGNPALLQRLRRARDLGLSSMTDVNGVELTGQVKFARALSLGRADLQNFALTFSDSPTFKHLGFGDKPALILGMSELRSFDRVAIDFEERKVLFDVPRASRVPSASSFRSYGVGS